MVVGEAPTANAPAPTAKSCALKALKGDRAGGCAVEDRLKEEVHLTIMREALSERRHRVGVELATIAFFGTAVGAIVVAFMRQGALLRQGLSPSVVVARMILSALVIGFGYGTIVRIRLSSRAFDRVTRLHDQAVAWLRERSGLDDLPAKIGRSSSSGRGTAHGFVIAVVLAVVYHIWMVRLRDLFCAELIASLVLLLAYFLPPLSVECSSDHKRARRRTPA